MADDPMVKVTIRLPQSVVKRARHYAVDADVDLQDVVADALRTFLAKKGGR